MAQAATLAIVTAIDRPHRVFGFIASLLAAQTHLSV